MANTLTNLIPTLVERFDVVSRELVGLIPSVTRDARADRVAKNQTLYSWAAPAATLGDITPGATSPDADDSTLTNKSITISSYKVSAFDLTAEEEYALGVNNAPIQADMIEQRIRALINQMEADVWSAAYLGGSRAIGTAGTTPFASDFTGAAAMKKILDDNGAPMGSRSLVIDTTAGAALRTLAQVTKVNEAGSDLTLRTGELLNLQGFSLKESAQVTTVTAGTGASYQLNGALSVGATSVTVDTGSGTILAGDVVTIGAHKYVVATALSGGTFTINAPGIRAAAADNLAITVNATSARNIALAKNAIVLATRLPARANDAATDVQVITDPRSGISLEVAVYPQYRQNRYEVSAAWGVTAVKPEHIAILLG